MDENKKERAQKVKEITIAEHAGPAWLYSDGSIRGEGGRMVKPLAGGAGKITPANAREMLARRQAVALRAQLEGLCVAVGIEPSDIDDELIEQAGSALRAFTAHFGGVFLGSKNLRGMSESFDKLSSPLRGEPQERARELDSTSTVNILLLIADYAKQVKDRGLDVIDL